MLKSKSAAKVLLFFHIRKFFAKKMLTDFIISRIKAELPFEPNAEKDGLFQALGTFIVSREERKAFILRGYAGTGKTSVMSALVRALEGLKQPCVLLAPTRSADTVLSR